MIVKKLGSVTLQMEKAKSKDSSSKRSVKDKAKSEKGKAKSAKSKTELAKDKSISTSTSCRHKERVASSVNSDVDTKSFTEIATFSQELRPLSLSKIKASQLLQSKTVASQAPRTNCKLPPGLRRSIAETVAALVDDTQNQRSGGVTDPKRSVAGLKRSVADPNVQKEPQRPENDCKALGTSRNLLPKSRRSLARTVAASADSAQSCHSRSGGVADANV
jgi:hypothetical protein